MRTDGYYLRTGVACVWSCLCVVYLIYMAHSLQRETIHYPTLSRTSIFNTWLCHAGDAAETGWRHACSGHKTPGRTIT